MHKNTQWHYWNNKYKDPNYSYDTVAISPILVKYINSLSGVNNFLDHGCGHGRITKILLEKFPQAIPTINDIIPEAIEITQNNISNTKLHTVVGQLHHVSENTTV